uniref:Putative secreted protein n=1 Tax=Anopheles darlingi TaxID=43151 RepID=A0A2M4D2J8_ANODA
MFSLTCLRYHVSVIKLVLFYCTWLKPLVSRNILIKLNKHPHTPTHTHKHTTLTDTLYIPQTYIFFWRHTHTRACRRPFNNITTHKAKPPTNFKG